MRRWLARYAVVAFTLTLVAPLVASSASANATTVGTTHAKISAADISLDYPSGWTVVTLTNKQLRAQRESLAETNPKLATLADAAAARAVRNNWKFHAIDLDAAVAGRIASNINVSVLPNVPFPSSVASFRSVLISALSQHNGTLLSSSAKKVGSNPAYRAEYTLPSRKRDGTPFVGRAGQEVVLLHGTRVVAVTVATLDDESGEKLIAQILDSLRPSY